LAARFNFTAYEAVRSAVNAHRELARQSQKPDGSQHSAEYFSLCERGTMRSTGNRHQLSTAIVREAPHLLEENATTIPRSSSQCRP
jgi:hypothetical protein